MWKVAVLMLAETIAATSMGQSTIFVDAGRHDELPDFVFGKGRSSKQHIQKVAPACVPWDKGTSVLLVHLILSFYPMMRPVSLFKCCKKQRLQINQEMILIEVGYCNDTSQLNKIEQEHHQHIG
jgi:hypothetical protein